ncbi:1-phosphofructokinase family hexose kinase [bacterium]|nr:1-phosphofructokinase family hexose kinase [bacterium]
MIYTLTLNPALDRTFYVDKIREFDSIKVEREERYAGGKGIDVSRVICQLGGESIAIGFLGGFVGKEMEGRLLNEGVACNFVWIRQETRTNVIIHSHDESEKEIRFNCPGPNVSPAELSDLFHHCRKLKPKPKFAVISGSVPGGIDPTVYEELVLIFEAQGARVILDTYGEPLRKGLLGTPFMIKPNKRELSMLVGSELNTIDEIISAARSLLEYVEIVAVSLGELGLLGVSENRTILAQSPQVDAVNTVGAGDSAVAGMVLALESELPVDEVIRRGAAAGTASTLTDGTATVDIENFEKILAQTKLKVV